MQTQRYKLTIAYRGTHYHGWQQQHTSGDVVNAERLPTVQDKVRRALVSVVKHPVRLQGSSRTDAGVHSKGQVAHFETHMLNIPPANLRRAANSRVPQDVWIKTLEPVPDTFDAIKSTIEKRYQYLIHCSPERPVFAEGLCWHEPNELDHAAMHAAAGHFVGEHDFTSFVRPGHGRADAVRTVFECRVSRRREHIVVGVRGNGFLWNQIRIMVGTLVEVGRGRRTPQDVAEALAARDRRRAGPTAPPQGLYLQWIRTKTAEATGEAVSGEDDGE
ncbi:MAG: tRNA pseudouridine(38-40) synthase TruA [Phycisphaerae bacterium]